MLIAHCSYPSGFSLELNVWTYVDLNCGCWIYFNIRWHYHLAIFFIYPGTGNLFSILSLQYDGFIILTVLFQWGKKNYIQNKNDDVAALKKTHLHRVCSLQFMSFIAKSWWMTNDEWKPTGKVPQIYTHKTWPIKYCWCCDSIDESKLIHYSSDQRPESEKKRITLNFEYKHFFSLVSINLHPVANGMKFVFTLNLKKGWQYK